MKSASAGEEDQRGAGKKGGVRSEAEAWGILKTTHWLSFSLMQGKAL